MYGPGYWNRYPNYRWGWGGYNNNWWAWATAGAVTSWLFTANTQPVYYDYGNTIYYQEGQVYQEGDVICSAEEYAIQAQTLAQAVPDDVPEEVEWLPLGVFAITEPETSAEDATLFLQLAVSKNGIIAGTFQNTATGNSFEVEGTIDQESQRAAWGPVGKSWPIMETGLYNLTENEASALVHFDEEQTQEWVLVRLDQPEEDGAANQ